MELQQQTSVLFCGMGNHARAVNAYLGRFDIRTIYVIYSQNNTPEYETKIHLLKTDIESIKGLSTVHFMQINEREIVVSFQKIARLYQQHFHDHIYTDLTAGHKIISYLLWYAHAFSSSYAEHTPITTYLWEESNTPIQLPYICPSVPDITRINFMRRIAEYYQTSPLKVVSFSSPDNDEPYKVRSERRSAMKLSTYLSKYYSRVQITRYRRELIDSHHLTEDEHLTITGEFMIAIAPI